MVKQRLKAECGIYLVAMSIFFTFAALVLIGVLVGVGLISSGRGQLQNVANMVALGALEDYVEYSPTSAYEPRLTHALARANEIAGGNFLTGGKEALGGITSCTTGNCTVTGGGKLTLGQWYSQKPASTDPCAPKKYPCFVPNVVVPLDPSSTNAVKVNLCNADPSNPILAPFMPWPAFRCVETYAALVSTCAAFLLDLSRSTAFETHYANPMAGDVGMDPLTGQPRIMKPRLNNSQAWELNTAGPGGLAGFNPALVGLPFYDVAAVQNLKCDGTDSIEVFKPSSPTYPQALFWCSMAPQRPANWTVNPKIHFQTDYRSRWVNPPGATPPKEVMVDVLYDPASSMGVDYFGPQPMESLFRGINSALRSMQSKRTSADRAVLFAFRNDIIDREPDVGMATDLGYLIQLTNFNNRGLRYKDGSPDGFNPNMHPNFMDVGWIIDPAQYANDKSNLVLAFDAAIEALNASCPATSDKVIMAFSDGVPSCARTTAGDPNKFTSSYVTTANYQYACGTSVANDKSMASIALADLYGGWSSPAYSQDAFGRDTVLTSLEKSGIRLSFFMSGDHVAPHEINRYLPNNPGKYMTQEEAVSLGYGMSHENDGTKYIAGWSVICPDPVTGQLSEANCNGHGTNAASYAWNNFPSYGFTFPDAVRAFGPMSLDTGGVWCPLRPKCKSGGNFFETPPNVAGCGGSCYVSGKLKDAARTNGSTQYCSITNRNKSEQAADCAIETISGNPYILVKEGVDSGTNFVPPNS